MKTTQEILNFFGVEIGKKYIITKNYYAFKAGERFEVEKDIDGCLKINNEGYTTSMYMLCFLEYEEVKPELLDKKERAYLSAVIKPFRDKVEAVSKRRGFGGKQEFIRIYLHNNDDYCSLPFFELNQMYKGMKVNKQYSLKELGL